MICIFQKISFINVDKGICMFAWVKLLWCMVMGTRTAAREILAYQCDRLCLQINRYKKHVLPCAHLFASHKLT